MTPRSLFAVILKIIGIYLVLGAIISIPQIMMSLYSLKSQGAYGDESSILQICFFVLFSLSFYLVVLYYCIYKTDWVIDKLRLDHGFREEKFELNIHRSTILRIAVIVMGGIMVINSLPILCKEILLYFQMTGTHTLFKDNPASGSLIFNFIELSLGFSFMSASRLVVNVIELKRKKPAQTEE